MQMSLEDTNLGNGMTKLECTKRRGASPMVQGEGQRSNQTSSQPLEKMTVSWHLGRALGMRNLAKSHPFRN